MGRTAGWGGLAMGWTGESEFSRWRGLGGGVRSLCEKEPFRFGMRLAKRNGRAGQNIVHVAISQRGEAWFEA